MKVLLATDLSATGVVVRTLLSSLTWPRGAELEVLHVAPPGSKGIPAFSARGLAARRKETATFARELGTQLAGRELLIRSAVRIGDPATVIVERGAEVGADLIAVGSHGRGHIARGILGSVSAGVVERAHSSVLVARTEVIRSLLVADDGSASVQAAIAAVVGQSLFDAVHVTIARVVDLRVPLGARLFQERSAYEHDERLRAARTKQAAAGVERRVACLREAGRMATGKVVHGDTATELLRLARSVGTDLVVVSARDVLQGRARLDEVTRSVLHGFHGSVLVARAPSSLAGLAADTEATSPAAVIDVPGSKHASPRRDRV